MARGPRCASYRRSSNANSLCGRNDHRKSVRPFKGIICHDISEFESYMPSQPVRSPPPPMPRPLKTARHRGILQTSLRLVSVCGKWRRTRHSSALSPRPIFGVSFLMVGAFSSIVGSTRRGTKAGGRARIRWAAEPIFMRRQGSSSPTDAFQKQLGLPLIAHNRWIDDRSPYREKYAISGNVTTDRRLWSRWMRYLRASGVRAYEQDWLSGPAVPERNLTSGGRFMDAMAQAAGQAGITLHYCMPLSRHFLQGTRYFNLLTIRVSGDRFDKQRWASLLFNGRLASALGEWPWTDVFISSETSNLLLSTLSASIVGIGDALGQFDRTNLLRVVRADGVIVKPDDPITPLDSAYIAQANNRGLPLLAAAQTRHEGSMTSYVFAFRQTVEQGTASFLPSVLGYKGPVYAYNY